MIRKPARFRRRPLSLLRGIIPSILAAVLCTLAGCQRSDEPVVQQLPDTLSTAPAPPQHPWAILYSYSPIGNELRAKAQITADTIWAGREVSYGHAPDPIVLSNTGVGLANAAATTQYIIDRYHPQGIIFAGIASPINKAHQIGDICLPSHWATFDYGYWGESGFMNDSVTVGFPDSAGFDRMLEIPVDETLLDRLYTAANDAAFQLRTVARRLPEIHKGGLGISGNAFIDNKGKREQFAKQLKAQITDTESAAVVQTATAAGIPVVALRVCAAPAGESTTPEAQAALKFFFDESTQNLGIVLRRFLEQ